MSTHRKPASGRVRCLLGMVGTDVHSKGIRTIAQVLRDAGVEVIYLGEHNSIDGMAQAALDEDADVVGLSFSSAAYLDYMALLVKALEARGIGGVPVMVGGLIHPDDHAPLRALSVRGIFGPGSTTEDIVTFVQSCGAN